MAGRTPYLWNDLRCPLTYNVRRGMVAGRPGAATTAVVIVVGAWILVCVCVCARAPARSLARTLACPKIPASRRSRAAGKLALSLVLARRHRRAHSWQSRVTLRVCKHLPHGYPHHPAHAFPFFPGLHNRRRHYSPSLFRPKQFFIKFNYCTYK